VSSVAPRLLVAAVGLPLVLGLTWLARMGGTAGSPHDPPSPTELAPRRRSDAAPAVSVAAAEASTDGGLGR